MAGSLNSGGGGHDGGFNLYEALLKYEESVKQTKIQIAQKEDAVANLNAQIAKLKVDNGRKKQYIERNKLQIQVVDAKMEAEIQRKKKFQSKAAEKEEELARVQADAEKGRAMLERVKEFDKQRKIKLAEIQKTFMEGYMQIPECARYIQQGEKLKEVEARNEKREKQIAENQAFLDEYRLTSHQEWEDFREDVVAVIQLKKDEEKRQKELAEVLANTKRLLEKKDVLEKKFQSGGSSSSSFKPSTPFPRRVPLMDINNRNMSFLQRMKAQNQNRPMAVASRMMAITRRQEESQSSAAGNDLEYLAVDSTMNIGDPDITAESNPNPISEPANQAQAHDATQTIEDTAASTEAIPILEPKDQDLDTTMTIEDPRNIATDESNQASEPESLNLNQTLDTAMDIADPNVTVGSIPMESESEPASQAFDKTVVITDPNTTTESIPASQATSQQDSLSRPSSQGFDFGMAETETEDEGATFKVPMRPGTAVPGPRNKEPSSEPCNDFLGLFGSNSSMETNDADTSASAATFDFFNIGGPTSGSSDDSNNSNSNSGFFF